MRKLKAAWVGLIWVITTVMAQGILLHAAETESVDVHVSIISAKSISAGTTSYDFGSLNVNASSVSATALIITNDSTSLIETYTLLAGNAISDSGGTDWTLAASTGPDQYALSAQFGASRPTDVDSSWASDSLTTSAQVCSSTQFGNGTANESGLSVSPSGGSNTRNLWFRIKTPNSVTDPGGHTATVTLGVQ